MNTKRPKLRNTYAKTPTVFQMEATECGAASLAMILEYHGKSLPLEKLRIDCGVSRDGCNAKNVLKGARKHNLKAKGYKKGLEALLAGKAPSIVHWNFDHFIVYEGVKNGFVHVNDPAAGRRKLTVQDFDDGFTGVVLEFEKEADFRAAKEKRTLFYYIREKLKHDRLSVLYVILIGLCLILPGLILPVLSQVFVDDVLLRGNVDWLKGVLWGMILVSAFQSLLMFIQSRFMVRFQTKMALESTGQFLFRLFRLPIQFFDQREAGDLSSRISSNDHVAGFLAGDLAATVLHMITAVFYLILLVIYNWKLTLVGIVFSIFNILFLKVTSERISNKKMKMEQDTGKLEGVLYSGLRTIHTLKASGAENEYLGRTLGYYAKVTRNEQELGTFNQFMGSIPGLSSQVTNVLILIIGGLDVIKGDMTIGMLVAFTALMGSFLGPVNALVGFGVSLQDLKAHMGRLNDIQNYGLDEKFEDIEKAPMEQHKLSGSVELRDVEFGYSLLDPPLIERFGFKVDPGRSIAFVGASGSGKSTVSKIVSGLYRQWKGSVILDGVDRRNVPSGLLENSIAVVNQDIVLFSGTVRDNITLWDDGLPSADLLQAAKDACIHEVITSKPGSYDHVLQEGGMNFSGGQRQRLEIARALALNPSILIMDEATSALDAKTEKDILGNIRKRGCTCIIVAHRLSAIRDCDEILVMENGKIVQRGTHEDLKDVAGRYADLTGQG